MTKKRRQLTVDEARAGAVSAWRSLTEERVIATLNEHRGLLALSAQALRVSSSLLRKYVLTHPSVLYVYTECNEKLGDVAEQKLYELVEAGDLRAITYLLSTKHKHRGYTRAPQDADAPPPPLVHVDQINITAIPSGTHFDAQQLTLEATAEPDDGVRSLPSGNTGGKLN
jgi:hypothetical protein